MRTAVAVSRADIRTLAEIGARPRVEELADEIRRIRSTFPNIPLPALDGRKSMAKASHRRARSWSAAQRRAVSVRMKNYWKLRRARKG